MRKILGILLVLFLIALPIYVIRSGGGAPAEERYDRIVSIAPSVTELLFAVGAGDQVVGVTRHCKYPPAAKEKDKVGDLVIDFEKLISLKPDVVFSSDSLARKTNLALRERGIRVVTVDARTFEEIAEQIRRIGRLTGHAEKGEEVAREMMERVRAVEERVTGKARPSVYVEVGYEPLWTAGPNSYAGDAVRRAGGRNIMFDLAKSWAPVSWEVVLARDPDVILIAHAQAENLELRAGWSGLKAVKAGRVHFVPEDAFHFPTPRLVRGLELAAKHFHEEN
ncbi:MAG: ABC transporter substrate-binding protein [Planctomycetota bacterium]|jgi:iron complex transport system substrate-binding protein